MSQPMTPGRKALQPMVTAVVALELAEKTIGLLIDESRDRAAVSPPYADMLPKLRSIRKTLRQGLQLEGSGE